MRASESWPQAAHLDLLRAGLLGQPDAPLAWSRWRARAAPLDPAARRLLPLALFNLRRLGCEPDARGLPPDLLRRARVRAERLTRRLVDALDVLAASAIPTVLLKGAALAHSAYPDPATRPMFDLDVMVPPERVAEAIDRLAAGGWLAGAAAHGARLVETRHSAALRRADGFHLDLHWRPFDAGFEEVSELWAQARVLEVQGRSTRLLQPVHGLLHACVHGLQWTEVSSCRWVADASLLLRREDGAFDWEHLVGEAARRQLGPTLAAALGYLEREGFARPPAGIVDRLARLRTPYLERLAQRARRRAPALRTPLLLLGLHATSYQRLRRRGALEPGFRGWRRFARLTWGHEIEELPRILAGRGLARLRDLARWRLRGAGGPP